MKDTTIAVDISKEVFEIAVSKTPGKVSERRRLSRTKFLPFFAQRPPAVVVMEACGSAHYWARRLSEFGHGVRLLPTLHTKPYVRRNKTDRTDVRGLLEANRNEEIHPVPIKTVDQHMLAALHRARSAWMETRTARINIARGILRELGIFVPVGARRFVSALPGLLEDADRPIPDVVRSVLDAVVSEIRTLQDNIKQIENQLKALAKQIPAVQILMSIPGIGLITSTAIVAFVGGVQRFSSCRKFASYFGLTPKEFSTGLGRFLGTISKQGNVYIRTLLTHGARSILNTAKRYSRTDPLSLWALQIQQRSGHNKAAIATANKLARIAYAVLKRGSAYEPTMAA